LVARVVLVARGGPGRLGDTAQAWLL